MGRGYGRQDWVVESLQRSALDCSVVDGGDGGL